MKSDHFYTVSQLERDIEFAYSDYIEEGIACFVPECPVPGTMPLHRFYHASKHDHLYTTSADEGAIAVAKRGYTSQGISCHVFASQIEGTQPLLRLFNSKTYDHLYTTSSIEADNAVKMYNYQSEGTACFVFTDPEPATIPLFRLVQSSQVKQHTVESQWAVLLCKFSNEKSEPPAAMGVPAWRDACTRFTTKSDSSFNLVRYYADVSHGKVDLTGSQVLGWYDIAAKLLPPNANGDRVPDKSQDEVIDLAKKAAKKAGVKIDKFVGVIVIMNEATGWAQGSPGAVAMDWRRVDGRNFDGTLVPRGPGGGNGVEVFAQEVGHGYGLDHSRIDGSNVDYQDQWDAMSTLSNVFSVEDPNYCARPPGFNAWNMRARGWLDEDRVWKSANPGTFTETIDLRPLHHRDLPGLLAAELPGIGVHSSYLVEFRVPERWDAGIPQATVLVHRFSGNEETGATYSPALLQQQLGIHSYVMKGTGGQASLLEGGVLTVGRGPSIRVTVVKIDAVNKIATVRLEHFAR